MHKGLSSANYDKHHRLKSASSIYFKNKSLQKPIVNAYVQLEKNIKKNLIIPIPPHPKIIKVSLLSHDVDELERYAVLRNLKTSIISRKKQDLFVLIRLRKIIRKKNI